jgi:hypothetical protein
LALEDKGVGHQFSEMALAVAYNRFMPLLKDMRNAGTGNGAGSPQSVRAKFSGRMPLNAIYISKRCILIVFKARRLDRHIKRFLDFRTDLFSVFP